MAANERRAREDSLETRSWSNWKLAMVPWIPDLPEGFEQRGPNQVGLIRSSIRDAFPRLARRCEFYEWQARRVDQPDRVVYVGSTCPGKAGGLRKRILEYCRNGSHIKDLINGALHKGYELWVRVQVVERRYPDGKEDAQELENAFLDCYDYAWNKIRNGDRRGILQE